MAIALAITGKPLLETDAESITIGCDPASTIALTEEDRIKPRHAIIRRVAGRWLVEVREAETIQVGDAEPARVHWLKAGDVIRLVQNGPEITFQPADAKMAQPAAAVLPVAPPVSGGRNRPADAGDSRIARRLAVRTALPAPVARQSGGGLPANPTLVDETAPAARLDSLFEPLSEPAPPSPAKRREPPVARTPPAPHPKRPYEPRDKTEVAGDDESELYRIAGERPQRPAPALRRGSADSGLEVSSQTTLGWVIIGVAIGLLVILTILAILFGSSGSTPH